MRILFIICFFSLPKLLEGQDLAYKIPENFGEDEKYSLFRLDKHIAYLCDTTGLMDFESVLRNFSDEDFIPIGEKKLHQDSVYWVKVKVVGNSSGDQRYWLSMPAYHFVTFYIPELDGSHSLKMAGSRVSPEKKEIIFDFRSAIRIDFKDTEEKTIYARVVGKDTQFYRFWLALNSAEPLEKTLEVRDKKYLFFLAIFLTILAYNFALFVASRERIYLVYILFISFANIFLLGYHYTPFVLPIKTMIPVQMSIFSFAWIFYLKFTTDFLNLKKNRPTSRTYIKILWLLAISMGVYFLSNAFLGVKLLGTYIYGRDFLFGISIFSYLYGIVVFWSVSYLALMSYRNGYQSSKYFLYANTILVIFGTIGLTIELGRTTGFIPFFGSISAREFTFTIVLLGLVSLMVLYGLAIGYRILILERDKSRAIQEKLKTQESINLQLEEKVTERTAQLEHRNKENELLLGEIHHRVKNNLQVISSLLKLQSRQLEEGKAKSAVLEGRDRVKAMALIHQRLYQQDQFSSIQMDEYIQKLVDNLAESYGFSKKDFELELNVAPMQLDVDTAVPLGLIINELVSNSFKHAFKKGKRNHLEISLLEANDRLGLKVEDNGSGISADFSIEKSTSFGLQLIYALAEELNGSVHFDNGQGTRVSISLKDYKTHETV